jgi:hypothetical protein
MSAPSPVSTSPSDPSADPDILPYHPSFRSADNVGDLAAPPRYVTICSSVGSVTIVVVIELGAWTIVPLSLT